MEFTPGVVTEDMPLKVLHGILAEPGTVAVVGLLPGSWWIVGLLKISWICYYVVNIYSFNN